MHPASKPGARAGAREEGVPRAQRPSSNSPHLQQPWPSLGAPAPHARAHTRSQAPRASSLSGLAFFFLFADVDLAANW